jgi:GNAT superfamily N-acetyltransferase
VAIEVRSPVGDDELQAGLDVVAAVQPDRASDLEEVKRWRSIMPGGLDLVGYLDGALVGCAYVGPTIGTNREVNIMRADVLPHARRNGVGTALYAELSRHAASRGVRELELWMSVAQTDGKAFAERRGFRELMRVREVHLDLTSAPPVAVVPPEGVQIVTLEDRPEVGPGMYEVGLEAIPDMPSVEPLEAGTYEEWKAFELDTAMLRPDLTSVALAGDEVIGYAILTARADGRLGKHRLCGVKRAWRGRGVALALKQQLVASAQASGMERLITENADDNAPMRAVNQRLGYAPAPDIAWMRGPLAPGVSG